MGWYYPCKNSSSFSVRSYWKLLSYLILISKAFIGHYKYNTKYKKEYFLKKHPLQSEKLCDSKFRKLMQCINVNSFLMRCSISMQIYFFWDLHLICIDSELKKVSPSISFHLTNAQQHITLALILADATLQASGETLLKRQMRCWVINIQTNESLWKSTSSFVLILRMKGCKHFQRPKEVADKKTKLRFNYKICGRWYYLKR